MLVGAGADRQPDHSPNHSADASHHRGCDRERGRTHFDPGPDSIGVAGADSSAQPDCVDRSQPHSIACSQPDSVARPQPNSAKLGSGRGRCRRRYRRSR
jgi:hypothetical protein